METGLLNIKASDFGLEESKAKQISDMFKPMLDKMESLEVEYNKVIDLPINKETTIQAGELKKQYVKVRTGTAAIHKELKSFYLNGGRFVDGWKNTQLMASQGIEAKLSSIENYFVNLEKERIEKLQVSRRAELSKYIDEAAMSLGNLGSMDDDVWNNYLTGAKTNFTARKAAEEKAAKAKAEAEHAYFLRQEQIHKENKELKEAQEANEKALAIEKAKADKLQAELETKAEAENLAIENTEKAKQAELSKGDVAKIQDLIADLEILQTKYTFKSSKNIAKMKGVTELINKVIIYIKN
jgi:hypothetical protein